MSSVEVIHPAQRSPIAGAGAALGALGIAVLTVALGLDPALPTTAATVVLGVGGLLALAVGVGAARLIQPRGGLLFDRAGRRIGVGLTGPRDVWWIPLERVAGTRSGHSSSGDEVAWFASLVLEHGLELVLLETEQRQLARDVAEAMARGAGLELLDALPDAPAPVAATVTVRLRRRVALQALLWWLGLALLVVGIALLLQVGEHPVFGILFAPVLALLGLCFLAIVVLKRFGAEVLEHRGGLWTHSVFAGRWRLSRRTVSAPRPVWRLRALSLRGARLELVGDDGLLLVGVGATTGSDPSVAELATLPGRFTGAGTASTSPP